jgi:hypothetical protein
LISDHWPVPCTKSGLLYPGSISTSSADFGENSNAD